MLTKVIDSLTVEIFDELRVEILSSEQDIDGGMGAMETFINNLEKQDTLHG